VLRNFVSLRGCRAISAGTTNRGDKEAQEDGKSKGKFVSKSERFLFVPAPLEVGRDAKDDEKYSVEEGLEDETNQGRRR